tara:strand:- start:140969 stop:142045 length:1077 start_codon:yes stop_codon:yes gene_type:complete
MLHAVIMAGGSGTRFWPASRKLKPKQLLALAGEQTMIQATADRLGALVPPDRQLVLTNQILTDAIAGQLPDLPKGNIVGEPCKRDTAPCVGLAATIVAAKDPDGTMVVMPSDHVIEDAEKFRQAIEIGNRLIDEDPGRIVTFGIKPNYPAESFGYIEVGSAVSAEDASVFAVKQFREKPDRHTAEQYVDSGKFYWNSGIFLWRASTILYALKSYVPKMHARLATIGDAIGRDDFQAVLQTEFEAIEGTSIDYAVMERYDNVVVVEAPFPWDDVGSWQALARLHDADEHGNTVVGSHIGIDTKGTIVHSDGDHTIVTIDVKDMIVVHTDDATLVAPKHAEERVREVVKELEARKLDEKL